MNSTDKPTVLIVEDNTQDFAELQDRLQNDFVVTHVGDFDEYKVRGHLQKTDVALVDLYENGSKQPRGLDIIKTIKAIEHKRRIPVIVMSTPGKAELEHVTQAMQNGGAQDFIWKVGPRAATKEELLLKVRNAWQRALSEANDRKRKRLVLRFLLLALSFLAIGTIISAFIDSQKATLAFQTLVVLVSFLAVLPWSEKYI